MIEADMQGWRECLMRQNQPQKTWKIEPFFRLVRDLLKPGDLVLEVGCGRGYGSQLLDWPFYYGVDASADEISHARRLFPKRCFNCVNLYDLYALGDVVVCCRVLCHVGDLDGAMTKLLRSANKWLCLFVAVGPEEIRKEPDAYFRVISAERWRSFGECTITQHPRNKYSSVIYQI